MRPHLRKAGDHEVRGAAQRIAVRLHRVVLQHQLLHDKWGWGREGRSEVKQWRAAVEESTCGSNMGEARHRSGRAC